MVSSVRTSPGLPRPDRTGPWGCSCGAGAGCGCSYGSCRADVAGFLDVLPNSCPVKDTHPSIRRDARSRSRHRHPERARGQASRCTSGGRRPKRLVRVVGPQHGGVYSGPPLDWRSSRLQDRSVRDVAQPGSAPEWGSGGRGFESRRPDGVTARVYQLIYQTQALNMLSWSLRSSEVTRRSVSFSGRW